MASQPIHRSLPNPPWYSGLGLFALVVLAYIPAFSAGFIWDDDQYVTQNPVLRTADGLRRIWFEIGATPQYYPLVHTMFWIEYRMYGFNPIGYHTVNILLHAASAVLLWRILRRLKLPGAWLAAALFGLHPVCVESVAWVTERKNVLSGFFYLAAALAYLRWSERNGKTAKSRNGETAKSQKEASLSISSTQPIQAPSASEWAPEVRPFPRLSEMDERSSSNEHGKVDTTKITIGDITSFGDGAGIYYALSVFLFICALLSKTVTASLPAAILLVTWWKEGSLSRRRIGPTLPMFALGAGFSALTAWMERAEVGAVGADWNFSIVDRCLIAGRACWFYLGKLLWPQSLVFIYPRWDIDSDQLWQYVYPTAAAALVASLFVYRKRIGRGPLVAMLLFGGTLLPALGFFNVFPMRYSFVADHFQYLAAIGPLTLVASIMVRAMNRFSDTPVSPYSLAIRVVLVSTFLTGLAVQTARQARIYRDAETLWNDTLSKNSACWLAHSNIAKILADRGRIDDALHHAGIVLKARPDLFSSHTNYGDLLLRGGSPTKAVPYYMKALKIKPDYLRAHFGLGDAFLALNQPTDAIEHYKTVLNANPDFSTGLCRLGAAYEAAGRFDEALRSFTRAWKLQPRSADALYGIARSHLFLGDPIKAVEFFERTIKAQPDFIPAFNDLATLLANQGQREDALQTLEAAIGIKPDYVLGRFNRAQLLEGFNRLDEAATEYESVLRLDPQFTEASLRLAALRLRSGNVTTAPSSQHAPP